MIGNFGGTPSLPPNSRRLLPRPVGSPVQAASLPRIDEGQGQESRVSGQVPPRGELTSTPAAASRISVAGAQTHTLTQQSMGCRDFTPPLNPAPFSAEPRVSQSAIRRQIPHSIMEISPAARYSPVTPSHSPVTPPLGVRLHQSIHPQSTQEFSHPESMPPESDESGLMPRLEPSVPDSVQKIIDFIGSNPRQSLPNHDRLRDLGYSISICINKAVCNLLRAADTDPNKHDFHVIMHIPEAPFFQLCNCIYGVKSTDLLIERVSWIQVQSRLSLSNFLRSITAAAVYRWVLEEKPAGLPAKTKDLEIMEKNIAAGKYWL